MELQFGAAVLSRKAVWGGSHCLHLLPHLEGEELECRLQGWVLVHSFLFRVTSPEKTETLKACHVEIVPILHLLCEQRLSSGLRKTGLASSLFSTQEPPGVSSNSQTDSNLQT